MRNSQIIEGKVKRWQMLRKSKRRLSGCAAKECAVGFHPLPILYHTSSFPRGKFEDPETFEECTQYGEKYTSIPNRRRPCNSQKVQNIFPEPIIQANLLHMKKSELSSLSVSRRGLLPDVSLKNNRTFPGKISPETGRYR